MKAAGLTSTSQLVNSQVGFDAGLEIGWALTHARRCRPGSLAAGADQSNVAI
jgi:hypothetical protein